MKNKHRIVVEKMKIQSIISHIFSLRKNSFFALFFVLSFVYLFANSSMLVYANEQDGCGFWTSDVTTGKCGGVFKYSGTDLFKPMAVGLINVEAFFANVASTIFVWILDPNSFSLIMNDGAWYALWKIVRDTMNMFFILILLFSAFATIYQIDRYRYNKLLLTVIIMALLVNFSWPISRAIIDFFNSMMYFFIQSIFHTNGSEAANNFLSTTRMTEIFLPDGDASDWPHIFAAIVAMGIFAYTLIRLSIGMLIRILMLPILVMVSPVGFAGMISPLTQKYASKWWARLFSVASYGPIVVFMILAAMQFLKQI